MGASWRRVRARHLAPVAAAHRPPTTNSCLAKNRRGNQIANSVPRKRCRRAAPTAHLSSRTRVSIGLTPAYSEWHCSSGSTGRCDRGGNAASRGRRRCQLAV